VETQNTPFNTKLSTSATPLRRRTDRQFAYCGKNDERFFIKGVGRRLIFLHASPAIQYPQRPANDQSS
jgi:hypothetical protein